MREQEPVQLAGGWGTLYFRFSIGWTNQREVPETHSAGHLKGQRGAQTFRSIGSGGEDASQKQTSKPARQVLEVKD
jgi:hypothetical protein